MATPTPHPAHARAVKLAAAILAVGRIRHDEIIVPDDPDAYVIIRYTDRTSLHVSPYATLAHYVEEDERYIARGPTRDKVQLLVEDLKNLYRREF